jgi:hypothetical protein
MRTSSTSLSMNNNLIHGVAVPLGWGVVAETRSDVTVRAALIERCRDRAPRPHVRMGSQL